MVFGANEDTRKNPKKYILGLIFLSKNWFSAFNTVSTQFSHLPSRPWRQRDRFRSFLNSLTLGAVAGLSPFHETFRDYLAETTEKDDSAAFSGETDIKTPGLNRKKVGIMAVSGQL